MRFDYGNRSQSAPRELHDACQKPMLGVGENLDGPWSYYCRCPEPPTPQKLETGEKLGDEEAAEAYAKRMGRGYDGDVEIAFIAGCIHKEAQAVRNFSNVSCNSPAPSDTTAYRGHTNLDYKNGVPFEAETEYLFNKKIEELCGEIERLKNACDELTCVSMDQENETAELKAELEASRRQLKLACSAYDELKLTLGKEGE